MHQMASSRLSWIMIELKNSNEQLHTMNWLAKLEAKSVEMIYYGQSRRIRSREVEGSFIRKYPSIFIVEE